MKIYLAARYSRFPEMSQYAKELTAHGHQVTSRWILGDHDIRAHGQSGVDHYLPQWAEEDWEDLVAAETIISFTEPPENVPGRSRGGRHVEFGIALGFGKRCITVGYRENIFHWRPVVEFFSTWAECLAALEIAAPVIHHVVRGDTLSGIAHAYGLTLSDLLVANPTLTHPDRISIGQAIVIPTGIDPNRLLHDYHPTGASYATALQDGLPAQRITGVAASRSMAETDRHRVMAHKEKFIVAAGKTSLPPALFAGIASRESRGGAALRNGWGDGGHGFGMMQIDTRSHMVVSEGGPYGQAHITQAAEILAAKLAGVQRTFPDLSAVLQLVTAVSRYNGGAGRAAPRSDDGTTGKDYANDVWARAQYYAQEETWSEEDA